MKQSALEGSWSARNPRHSPCALANISPVPVLIIAEAGMNHDGSLGNAMRMVETAAACGADAVKFQLHDADAETVRDAPSPPYFTTETRYEYFQRTAFTDDQWRTLRECCDHAGIEFVCSPFSLEAVERLERIGVSRYKVPSGEITNTALVAAMAATGRPLVISSGMSSWDELDAAVETAVALNAEVTIMQCTSEYPCPPEHVGLNVLAELEARYNRPVGLSDHTLGLYAAFAAVALGARSIEKHFTLSKELYGPDAALAAEPAELRDLVSGVRAIETMLLSRVDKNDVTSLREMKRVFEKSVVALVDIPGGATIDAAMLGMKKPGTGIPARRLPEIVGRVTRAPISADSVISESDIDWGNR